MSLAVVSQGLGCIFYSDLFITEGYKVDNQIFQIKGRVFLDITKLRLLGFKSFVDSTEVEILPGLTE